MQCTGLSFQRGHFHCVTKLLDPTGCTPTMSQWGWEFHERCALPPTALGPTAAPTAISFERSTSTTLTSTATSTARSTSPTSTLSTTETTTPVTTLTSTLTSTATSTIYSASLTSTLSTTETTTPITSTRESLAAVTTSPTQSPVRLPTANVTWWTSCQGCCQFSCPEDGETAERRRRLPRWIFGEDSTSSCGLPVSQFVIAGMEIERCKDACRTTPNCTGIQFDTDLHWCKVFGDRINSTSLHDSATAGGRLLRRAARRSSTCGDTYDTSVCETFRQLGWCEGSETVRDNCRGSCDNCPTCSSGNVVCLQRASSDEVSLTCPSDATGGNVVISTSLTSTPSLPQEGNSGHAHGQVVGGKDGSDDQEATAQAIIVSLVLALGVLATLALTRLRRKSRTIADISEDGSCYDVSRAEQQHPRTARHGSMELFKWSDSATSISAPMEWDDMAPANSQSDTNPAGVANPTAAGWLKGGKVIHHYDLVGVGHRPLPPLPATSGDENTVNIGRNSSKRASVVVDINIGTAASGPALPSPRSSGGVDC